MELTRPRGTRDFLFDEMEERKTVETKLRKIFENYAYHEINTPLFENLSLFTMKSGEGIIDQLYNFEDKSGREITLRPEITAPVARLYINELQKSPKPIKMYYYGSCFRYERPQAGRFRQFWQFGCELIGGKTPEADAEVITMAGHALDELEIEGYEINVGHLGVLRGLFKEYDIPVEKQSEIMAVIDKGIREELEKYLIDTQVDAKLSNILLKIIGLKGNQEVLETVEELIKEYPLALEELNNLKKLVNTLDSFQMKNYILNLGIARGLDYYTGMVFEVYVPRLGAQKQICGGGTYNLIESFGGEHVESTGFAFGFDRLMAAIPENKIKSHIDVFVAPINDKTRQKAYQIAQTLRLSGINTEVDLSRRKFKKLLSYANNINAKITILVGENDLKEGNITAKNMETGDQEIIKLTEISTKIKEMI